MPRNDRLIQILGYLKDGALHRAEDLACIFGVSVRTIYRDIERLQKAGVPVEGTRGEGYRSIGLTTLPPMALSDAEVNALSLGVAIIQQAGDDDLAQAANSLAEKINAALPEHVVSDSDAWKFAFTPLADPARGLSLLPTLRSAIRARQKVELTLDTPQADIQHHRVRPLKLACFGPIWTLSAWSETTNSAVEFRLDLMKDAKALPELFSVLEDR